MNRGLALLLQGKDAEAQRTLPVLELQSDLKMI